MFKPNVIFRCLYFLVLFNILSSLIYYFFFIKMSIQQFLSLNNGSLFVILPKAIYYYKCRFYRWFFIILYQMNILRNFTQKQPEPANPEVMNQTVQNTTLQKFNDPDNKPVFEMPSQTSEQKPEEQKCQLSKRSKIILGVSIAIAVIGLALGLALGLTLGAKYTAEATGPIAVAAFDDENGMAFTEVQLKSVSKFNRPSTLGPRIFVRRPLARKVPSSVQQGRTLQQEDSNGDLSIHINFEQLGITCDLLPDGNLGIEVKIDKFVSYLESQVPQSRLLQENESDRPTTIEDLKEQLGQVIRTQFEISETVRFSHTSYETYELNNKTGNFERSTSTEDHSRLLVTIRNLWRRGRPWRPIQQIVRPVINHVVKPVVQEIKEVRPIIEKAGGAAIGAAIGNMVVPGSGALIGAVLGSGEGKKIAKVVVEEVRDNGKIIGTVGGAVVGGVVGTLAAPGPGTIAGAAAGAAAGASLGGKIGSVSQNAVRACVPEGTLQIRCEKQEVITGTINVAQDLIIGQVTGALKQVGGEMLKTVVKK